MQTVDWDKKVKEKSNGKISFVRNFWDKDYQRQYIILKCEKHQEFKYEGSSLKVIKTLTCPYCKKEEKDNYWNLENIQKEVSKLEPNYIVKDIREKKEFLVSCGKHDFYWTSVNTFFNIKARCKLCDYEKKNKIEWTKEKCIEFINKKGFSVLDIDNLINAYSKVILIDKLGYKYKITARHLSSDSIPHKYIQSNPFTIENIKLWISLNRPDYELISTEYVNAREKMKFKYIGKFFKMNDELRYFEMNWNAFNSGKRNSFINIPVGEEKVYKFLEKNNILFEFQKSFDDCVNPKTNYKLYYDFLIKDKDGNYIKNIEVDGLQHDNIIDFWGGEEGFKDRKFKEKIKEDYMKSLKIPVLRIKKKDFKNIENILLEKLLKQKGA